MCKSKAFFNRLSKGIEGEIRVERDLEIYQLGMGQTKVQFKDIYLGGHYKNQDLRRVVIRKGHMYGASEVDGKILFLDPMVVIRMFTLDCAMHFGVSFVFH